MRENKIKLKCINEVPNVFDEGKEYEAFWDGDGYNEPMVLLTTDELGNTDHIIAEHSLEDDWFKEHFVKV